VAQLFPADFCSFSWRLIDLRLCRSLRHDSVDHSEAGNATAAHVNPNAPNWKFIVAPHIPPSFIHFFAFCTCHPRCEDSFMDDDGDGLTGSLGAKLAGWCALYGVAMLFIVLRIFARLYIFGALTLDDWLMIAVAVAYTGSMITEIFLYLAFQSVNIVNYIKVSTLLGCTCLIIDCIRTLFHRGVDNVAHQVLRVGFPQTSHTRQANAFVRQYSLCHPHLNLYRFECVQSHLVCSNSLIMGP